MLYLTNTYITTIIRIITVRCKFNLWNKTKYTVWTDVNNIINYINIAISHKLSFIHVIQQTANILQSTETPHFRCQVQCISLQSLNKCTCPCSLINMSLLTFLQLQHTVLTSVTKVHITVKYIYHILAYKTICMV